MESNEQYTDQEDKELQGTRYLFSHLFLLPTVKESDLKRVLSYPLTSVPLNFTRSDELKISTEKSIVFSKLEMRLSTDAPRNIDVCIASMECSLYRLMYICHSTFGGIANVITRLVRRTNREDLSI